MKSKTKTQVIVDGYNVVKTTSEFANLEAQSLQLAREALVTMLCAKASQYDIILVFDAWQSGQTWEQTERTRGIRVIYTRRGERADDVIVRLAASSSGTCIVVSKDQAVRDQAQARGCQVAAPEALFTLPKRSRKRGPRLTTDPGQAEENYYRQETKKGPSRRPKKRRGPPQWRF